MNKSDYVKEYMLITQTYEHSLHELRMRFVEENADFKIGDFIGNVTGIIKVERIGYNMMGSVPTIIYHGYRYKKVKGVLSRTKDKNISHLLNYNLKLIK